MNIFDDDVVSNKVETTDKQMVIRFYDIEVVKNLINILSQFLCDISIKFIKINNSNEVALKIDRITENKNVLIKVNIKTCNLLEYFCDSNFVIGIDLLELKRKLSEVDKNDNTLTLSIEKNNLNELSYCNGKHIEKIKLIELDYKPATMNSNYDTVIRMKSEEFKEMCELMRPWNYLKIEVKNEKYKLYVGENYDKKIKTFCEHNCGDNYSVSTITNKTNKINYEFETLYEVNILKRLSACNKLSSEIRLYIKEDYPLGIKFNISNIGEMIVMICPCVKESYDDNIINS